MESSSGLAPCLFPRKYWPLGFLGQGGFGEVFKCVKADSKETVAVKIPRGRFRCKDEVALLKFLMSNNLDKCNIVRFIDSFTLRDNRCAMAFEVLDMTLRDYIIHHRNLTPLDLHDVRRVIQQMATALDALKTFEVIHADIKLDNIMLVDCKKQPLRVKLIDFGLAFRTAKAKQGDTHQIKQYRAPEIILGLPFSEAIDMWSLGVVMAYTVLCVALFPGRTEYDTIRCIVDLLGVPPHRLLKAGKYSSYYFTERRGRWRLKPPEEYWTVVPSCKDFRTYQFCSLDDVEKLPLKNLNMVTAEEKQECINLLKAMLQIDASKRITPSQVLAHPFITRVAGGGLSKTLPSSTSHTTEAGTSGTAEPGTSGTAEPGTGGTAEPGTSGTAEPGTGGTAEPGTSGTAEPGTSGTAEPGTGTSGTTEPGTGGTAEPGTGTSGTAKPGTRGTAKPGTGGTAKPGTGGTAKPGTSGTAKLGTGGTAKPGTSGTAKPGTRGTAKPGTRGTVKPGTGGTVKPGTRGTAKPGTGGTVKPGTGGTAKPGTRTRGTTEPGTSGTSEPGTGGTSEPGTGGTSEPGTSEAGETESTAGDCEVSETLGSLSDFISAQPPQSNRSLSREEEREWQYDTCSCGTSGYDVDSSVIIVQPAPPDCCLELDGVSGQQSGVECLEDHECSPTENRRKMTESPRRGKRTCASASSPG